MPVTFSTEEVVKPTVSFSVEEPVVGMPAGFEPNQIDKAQSPIKFSVEEPVAAPKVGVMETGLNIAKGLGTGVTLVAQSLGHAMKWAAEWNQEPDKTTDWKKVFGKAAGNVIRVPVVGQTIGEQAGKLVEDYLPQWHKTADAWLRETTKRYGQNVSDYYKRGLEGDLLEKTPDYQLAEKLGWRTAPLQQVLVTTATSAPSYIAALTAGLMLKNPHIPLAILGGQTAAQSYGDLRSQNVKPDVASTIALLNGAWEAVTEKIPFDILLKNGGKNLLSRFLKSASTEGFQEFLANAMQNYTTHFGLNYNPDKPESLPAAFKISMGELFNGWFQATGSGLFLGGGAALATGLGPRQAHIVNQTEDPKPVDDIAVIQDMKDSITDSTTLTPEEKQTGMLYVGDIETKVIKKIIDKYPEPVDDNTTIDSFFRKVAKDMGMPDWENYTVSVTNKKVTPGGGSWASHNYNKKTIQFALGNEHVLADIGQFWESPGKFREIPNKTPGKPNQDLIKAVMVHEIGHAVKRPTRGPSGRRSVHHKEFQNWVNENVKSLHAEQKSVVPANPANPDQMRISRQDLSGITSPTLPQDAGTAQGPGESTQGIIAYHGSTKKEGEFNFRKSESEYSPNGVGVHFGTEEQAAKITTEKGGKISSYKLDIKNPLRTADLGYWSQSNILNELLKTGVITKEEYNAFIYDKKGYDIVKVLESKGYDSIVYKNDVEGSGDSYLVFKPEQVLPITQPAESLPAGDQSAEKKPGLSRKRLLALGHSIPDLMGWSDLQRRDFLRNTVGKDSMKDMTLEQMQSVVAALQAESTAKGYVLQPGEEPKPADDLMGKLKTSKLKAIELGYNPPKWRKFLYDLQTIREKGGDLMQLPLRMFDVLDGGTDGPWHQKVYKPLMDASSFARVNANARWKKVLEFFHEKKIDLTEFFLPQQIQGTRHRLSADDRVYIAGQINNSEAYERLLNSGFTDAELKIIKDSITPEEDAVRKFALEEMGEDWVALVNSAVRGGWDISSLKKVENYLPLEGLGPIETRTFIDELIDFARDSKRPDSGMLITRIPGAKGKLNLSLMEIWFNHIVRVERFKATAPIAKEMRSLMANTTLKAELDSRTFNQGTKILSDFIGDKIRGGITANNKPLDPALAWLRHKGTTFAAARNILICLRQTLATCTTMADDPQLIPYMIKNALDLGRKGGLKALEGFVTDSSLYMKDRSLSNNIQKYLKKKKIIELFELHKSDYAASKWYVGMDKGVANLAWKSYYELSLDKLAPGDIKAAMKYADERTQKTQSMVHTEDLSPLYKGSELTKNIVAFTREVATLGNYWYYDVYQAYSKGEIGTGKFAYRVFMSYMLPALLFGMISRGRLQKDKKEVTADLGVYLVGPSIFLSGLMNKLMTGLDSGLIAFSVFDSLYGVIQQATKLPGWAEMDDEQKSDTIHKLMKKIGMTIGGLTGKISAQDIRSIEGAWDLYQGNTNDPRRLIWSEYALTKDDETGEDYGSVYK